MLGLALVEPLEKLTFEIYLVQFQKTSIMPAISTIMAIFPVPPPRFLIIFRRLWQD